MHTIENIAIPGYKGLATAVVVRAIVDWRRLTNGAKETRDCNFKELEHFFRHECDLFLTGTGMSGAEILKKLKKKGGRK